MRNIVNLAEEGKEKAIKRLEAAALRVAGRGGVHNLHHAARLLDGARFLDKEIRHD